MERCCWSPYCAVSPAAPAWPIEIDFDEGIHKRLAAPCSAWRVSDVSLHVTQNDAPRGRFELPTADGCAPENVRPSEKGNFGNLCLKSSISI